MAENLGLDAKIEVSGFKELDSASYPKLKKIVEKYAGRYEELCSDFRLLSVKIKAIHKKEKSEKYEIKGSVNDGGKRFYADSVNFDFFAALHETLKDLENALSRRK